jgi:hypothetical protein
MPLRPLPYPPGSVPLAEILVPHYGRQAAGLIGAVTESSTVRPRTVRSVSAFPQRLRSSPPMCVT